jgi:hypothetical protein
MLTLSLAIGYRAWGTVSGSYRDQVVLSGILSSTPQSFRITAGGQCVGVLATSNGPENEKNEDPTFWGGGHINLKWNGRIVTIGGHYRLIADFMNRLSVVSATISGLSNSAQLTLMGSDKYQGTLSISTNGASQSAEPPRSIPLVLPGPLTISRQSDGTFDILAPIRSFQNKTHAPFRPIVSFERGSCDPNGALDLSKILQQLSADYGKMQFPLTIPMQ